MSNQAEVCVEERNEPMVPEKIKVIVVDDDPGLLKTMTRNLSRRGYETDAAESGIVAIEKITHNDYDIVLMDQTMPEMSGIEVLERLTQKYLEIPPVIMITAADSRYLAVEFMKLEGAADFSPKPVNFEMLDVQIRAALKASKLKQSRDREYAARIAAEEAGRMKDRFLASIGHEFRTPLNVIIGFTQLMMNNEPACNDKDGQENIETILDSAHQMKRLVDDLLQVTEIESNADIHLEIVDLDDMLKTVIKKYSDRFGQKKLDFRTDFSPDFPFVTADPYRLAQVIDNLLDNAAKFTKEGGVRLAFHHRDDVVRINIRDTGIGIAPENHNRIFNRFWKLDRSGYYSGTGMGLYLAKFWTEKMGGRIDVESELGMGATFQILLPVHHE